MTDFKYGGKTYSISQEASELVDLLKRWDWGERSIAIALGIRRGHATMSEIDHLSGGLAPEVIQAIDIAHYEHWSISKIGKATAISERQITDWLLSRKCAQESITKTDTGNQDKVVGALSLLGLRPGELANLRVGDIDHERHRINLKDRKVVF